MNMETGYELSVPVGDGNKDVKAIISNNEVIWERAIPTPKSGVAPLSFRATRAKPLLDWEITGKTYQAWTPSPEPQVGNNKLDNSKIEKSSTITNFAYTDSSVSFGSMTVGSTINSAEIKAEDTSYAFSFSGDTSKVSFALKCYNSSHTYLGDANKLFDEESRAVMTLLANTTYIRLVITTTVQGNVSLTNLMLNKGNTVMTFEPFGYLPNTGVCPVQGVGDKTGNLFDENTMLRNGAFLQNYQIINDSEYTETTNTKYRIIRIPFLKSGEYTISIFWKNQSNDARILRYFESDNITMVSIDTNTYTFNVNSDGLVGLNFRKKDSTDFSDNDFKIMLNSGSEPLPYEPFGYEIPVVSRRKNLVNQSEFENLSNWTELQQGTNRYILDIHGLSIGEQYIVSSDKNQGGKGYYIYINRYDENGNSNTIARLYQQTYLDANLRTFTVEKGYKYRFWIWSDNPINLLRDVKNIQLELGSTATEYEPYIEPITSTIYLNSQLMADETLDSTGKREVEWGVKVLTGDEEIKRQSFQHTNILNLYIAAEDICGLGKPYGEVYTSITKFSNVAGSENDNIANVSRLNTNGTNILIDVSLNDFSEYWEFSSFLKSEYDAGHPVTIYYQLATPTSEIVEIPEIPTLKGTTAIDVDTEVQPSNVSITYLSSGFEPQPLKTADGQILYTNNNQPLNTLE